MVPEAEAASSRSRLTPPFLDALRRPIKARPENRRRPVVVERYCAVMQLGLVNRRGWAAALVAACLLVVLVVLVRPAAAGPVGPHHYVALGDSYTSGPGIPQQTPESGACRRSDHNYPHLVAVALEAG